MGRFRVRTLLVAVAVLAVVLSLGIALAKRRARFGALANYHAVMSLSARRGSASRAGFAVYDKGGNFPARRFGAAQSRLLADYHLEMMAKYRRASTYYWLPIAADPPDPADQMPRVE